MITNPPSILISINTSWNIVHFRASLLRGLRHAGYAIASAAPEDAYTPTLRTLVDSHHPLPMDNAGTSLWRDALLCWRYCCLLRRTRPQMMLTYTIKPNIYGGLAARLLGIPVVANISGLGTAFLRQNWLTHLAIWLYRHALRRAHHVFFQNQDDWKLFLSHGLVEPARSSVLLGGSGIDLDYFHPRHNVPSNASAPLRFLMVARLLRDKGVSEYVAAARILKAQDPSLTFSLLGPLGVKNPSAILPEEVEAWQREGIIVYLGESDAVRDVMATHDVVVLPSYREGMSRVLMEAAAMAKPLIATDVIGCRDIVREGINGYLCQPRDVASLVAACTRMRDAEFAVRDAMAAQSRRFAEAQCDEANVIDAYMRVIRM